MNRRAINQALSKSLAYRAAGKADAANYWAAVLLHLLSIEGIIPQIDASSRTPKEKAEHRSSTFNSYFTEL